MYLSDTVENIEYIVHGCYDILRKEGITKIGKITNVPNIGATIFVIMCKLNSLKFGIFTDDVLDRFKGYVLSSLKENINNREMYVVKKNTTLTENVFGLLDTVARLMIMNREDKPTLGQA